MNKVSALALGVALSLGLAACSSQPLVSNTVQQQPQLSSGISPTNMDTTVAPQQDFFRYVNGNWLSSTDIPADKARWGSFDELRENADKQVLAIIQELAATAHANGTDGQKMADLYRSYLNEELINVLGLNPLRGDIARIDNLNNAVPLVPPVVLKSYSVVELVAPIILKGDISSSLIVPSYNLVILFFSSSIRPTLNLFPS